MEEGAGEPFNWSDVKMDGVTQLGTGNETVASK